MLLAAIGFTANGAQGVFEWSKNRQQQVVTVEQIEKERPSGGWFKITNASLDVSQATWTESVGSINDVYVPIHSNKAPDKEGTVLLLSVHDEGIRETVEEMRSLQERDVKDEEFLKYMLQNAKKIYIERPIEGQIKFGMDDVGSKERGKIAALDPNLAPDFAVLDENAKPNGLTAILKLVGGLIGTLIILGTMFTGKSENEGNGTNPNSGGKEENTSQPFSSPPPPMA